MIGALGNVNAILAPLVGERTRARNCDSKIRGRSRDDGERKWLDRDGRCDRGRRNPRRGRQPSVIGAPTRCALDVVNRTISGTRKHLTANAGCIPKKVNTRQSARAIKRKGSNGRDAAGDRDIRQPRVNFERRGADGRDRQIVNGGWNEQSVDGFGIDARDLDFTARACVGEEAGSRSRKPSFGAAGEGGPARFAGDVVNSEILSRVIEHTNVHAGSTSPKESARQSPAFIERPLADGGDAVWDRHARQSTAVKERKVTDGGDAVGDGHARQSTAPIERRGTDGGDAVGDGHAR